MDIADRATAPVVVAIDGPAGTGKSTVSKAVAARLGLSFLDTGAMYRAMTWWALTHNITDPLMVAKRCDEPVIIVGTDAAGPTITVNGRDVSAEIRTDEVTKQVSAVSAIGEVRERMVDVQRASAEAAPRGIVAEGRDIGTTVFPQATAKVFLTAPLEVRKERRAAQLREQGKDEATVERMVADLERRDEADSSREVSPLRPAEDAVVLDTRDLDEQQVIDRIVAIVEQRVRT